MCALTLALHWYRAMPFNPPGSLAKVTVPTLVVPSDSDPALGRTGAELTHRSVTGPYTCHTLTGIGHWIPEQAADEVAGLLRAHLDHRSHLGAALPAWIEAVDTSQLPGLTGVALHLLRDLGGVTAGPHPGVELRQCRGCREPHQKIKRSVTDEPDSNCFTS